MRTIEQFAVVPPTLRLDGAGGEAHEFNLNAHNNNPNNTKKFSDHWNNPDVRGVLYANQGRVCAYCCRKLLGGDRGDVEHFRPKKAVSEDRRHGGYWWLGYSLSNYVLSCRTCNSSRKGNKFPLQNPATRATFETDARAEHEVRSLIYPKGDNLDQWFRVDLRHRLLRVVPRDDLLSPFELETAETSLRFFRINSDQFLITERMLILEATMDAIEKDDFEAASKLASRFSPQSIVARQVLLETTPHHIPDRSIELGWLLDAIIREFDVLSSVLEEDPSDDRSKKELRETMWMLATLLKSPPDGNVQRVTDLCDSLGIRSRVDELANSILLN